MIELTLDGIPLRFETAPSLFSPKKADAGTLAMLSRVAFAPDDKVLDLGCGYGLVGIYAAKRIGAGAVFMLDNDALAVDIARRNLALNGISGVTVALSDGFRDFRETGFTKILCNPPYHADFAVPKHFIEKGFNRLAPGGSLFLVTKREKWYANKFRAIFGGSMVSRVSGYSIFEATRRSATYANRETPRGE